MSTRKRKVVNLEESDLERSSSNSNDSDDDDDDFNNASDDTEDLILQTSSAKKSTNKKSATSHTSSSAKKVSKKTPIKSKTITSKTPSSRKVVKPPPPSKKSTTYDGSNKSKSTANKEIDGSVAIVKSESKQSGNGNDNIDSFDVLLPSTLFGNDATCSVMIQVDHDDAKLLDYDGVSGAIGRFESTDNGIVLDLKGCQYQGSLLPGPTALVVGFSSAFQRTNHSTLRVEAITDEFATLVKTNDSMAKLDAVVQGHMDDSFQIRDENVNATVRNNNKKDQVDDGDAADSSALCNNMAKRGNGTSAKKLKK